MGHLDNELTQLRGNLVEMFLLVQKQLRKSMKALTTLDKDLAREVLFNERRVNAEELKIDKDCENLVALFSPVAVDLRFIFAAFKINSHLESIGDSAKGISKFVLEMEQKFDEQFLKDIELARMYEMVDAMIENNIAALRNDDTAEARVVFNKDEEVDAINKKATKVVADYISQSKADLVPLLNMISVIRRLERVGDLSSNIAEEIIFHVEAKVLKHEKEKL
ncbi:MAG: phosphate signaling complex protein PhoU [Chitinophagales bacterium]